MRDRKLRYLIALVVILVGIVLDIVAVLLGFHEWYQLAIIGSIPEGLGIAYFIYPFDDPVAPGGD
jgi:hypothetical protein